MGFKMKNPSMAKMVKMAGNNRVATQVKAEEAMKMKKAMKLKEAMKMKEAVKMKEPMKMKKEPMEFNAKLRQASKEGKIKGKFKEIVDAAPKMKKGEAMKMKKGEAMKMKEPMKLDEADKKKAIENAMPAAEKEVLSSSTVAGMKKYFGGVNADYDAVRAKLLKARKSGDNNYQEMRKIAKARYPNLTRML